MSSKTTATDRATAAPPRVPQLRLRPRNTLLQRTLPGSLLAALDTLEPALGLARRFAAFRRLASHQLFPEIHGRLADHQSPYRVARWVQDSVPSDDPLGSGVMKVVALERSLHRYRALLPPELLNPENYFQRLFRHAVIAVDVVNEMAQLVRYQQMRVGLFAERERLFPVPLEQQRREVMALNQLLRDLRDTQIALGITPGVIPGTPIKTVIPTDDTGPEDPISKFLAENPGSIPAFMAGLDRLMADGADEDPDGSLTPLPTSVNNPNGGCGHVKTSAGDL